MVIIRFEMGEQPLIFSDAIVISETEYEKLSADDIENIKQDRYNTWYSAINSPAEE